MIKINKSLTELDGFAKNHYQLLLNAPFLIKDLLKNKYENPVNSEGEIFFKALHDHIEDIIIARPLDLESNRIKLLPLYENYMNSQLAGIVDAKLIKKKKIEIKDEVLKVFNYSKFTGYNDGDLAYSLARTLEVNVCLYCNRQYTFTLLTKSGKTRPQFDHFYDKATYPFFAVSFYNLIPSCSICNSSLKNTTEFTISDNIHPYIEGIENNLSFSINIEAVDFIEGNVSSYDIGLKDVDGVPAQTSTRCKNNLEIFKILDLYNMHKDYVNEIIKKAYYYNKSRVDELLNMKLGNSNDSLFKSKEEVYEFLLCNYIKEKDFTKRVLSKLTKDIAIELKLIEIL